MIPHSKQPNNSEHHDDASRDEGLEHDVLMAPADFSDEELVLAHDLQRLFPLEQEQLPPRFVQTLASEETIWVAPTGLEQRVTYQVFRRLYLPRQRSAPPGVSPGARPRGRRPGPAPRLMTLGMLLVVIIVSLVTAVPSITQGLRVLVTQTGAQGASHAAQPLLAPQDPGQYLTPQAVRNVVPFPVYWPGMATGMYQLRGLVLHMGQSWADGPVVDFQYARGMSPGSGILTVREFRPVAHPTILQVVDQGAWHLAQVGNKQAIYIDGQWVQQRMAIVWRHGTQAELLYRANGLMFWITADQHDGAGEAMLAAVAQELMPLSQPPTRLAEQMLRIKTRFAEALTEASLGEVFSWIQVDFSSGTKSPVYIALGTPPESTP